MKVLIASDTHGRHSGIEEAIFSEQPLDLLIHLGDADGYEDYYEEIAGCPVVAVAGNNDFFGSLPDREIIELCGERIFLTHGHRQHVHFGYERLAAAAQAAGCSVAMFGHIHEPVLETFAGITLVNPGSLTFPRQAGRKPSYIVMTDDDGTMEFEIRYLD